MITVSTVPFHVRTVALCQSPCACAMALSCGSGAGWCPVSAGRAPWGRVCSVGGGTGAGRVTLGMAGSKSLEQAAWLATPELFLTSWFQFK